MDLLIIRVEFYNDKQFKAHQYFNDKNTIGHIFLSLSQELTLLILFFTILLFLTFFSP